MSQRKPLFMFVSLALILGATACDDQQPPDDGVADGDIDADTDDVAADNGETPNDVPEEVEPCETWGEARGCDGGMQFCDVADTDDPTLVWGECLASYECSPGDEQSCGEFEDPVTCELAGGVPYWPECPWTPLVLSFDGAPISLATSSAAFDIGGTGMCLDTDWPAASTPWLAIDLDRNGLVDGGHELFGSGSVLASGRRATNGFIALEALDSNRDGHIDRADARFAELLVWRDEDGDKQSTGWELTSLADERIDRIDLAHEVRERCDARSNCERERSSFTFMVGDTRRAGEVVDVYLACQ